MNQFLSHRVISDIFPDKLKIAKITPILKAADASSVEHYRQISVLPVFSKIFERVVYDLF